MYQRGARVPTSDLTTAFTASTDRNAQPWCIYIGWYLTSLFHAFAACFSVIQAVAVCCDMLQYAAVCCSVLQCAAMCRNVLQYFAVCCSNLPLLPSRFLSVALSYSLRHYCQAFHSLHTNTHTDAETHSHTDTQTHSHSNTQTYKQKNIQTHKRTDAQTHRHRHTYTHTHTQTHPSIHTRASTRTSVLEHVMLDHQKQNKQTVHKSIWKKQAQGTLDLPQTSGANPVQCYSTHQEKHVMLDHRKPKKKWKATHVGSITANSLFCKRALHQKLNWERNPIIWGG